MPASERKGSRWGLGLAALGIVALSSKVCGELSAPLLRWDVEHFDVERLFTQARDGRNVTLRLLGRDCELHIEPSRLRSERFEATAVHDGGTRRIHPPQAWTFKGTLAGEPESSVRLSFSDHGMTGFVKSREGWTYLEPDQDPTDDRRSPAPNAGSRRSAGGGSRRAHRVFTDADLDPAFAGHCPLARPAAAAEDDATGGASAHGQRHPAAEGDLLVLELAVDADTDFFATHGPRTAAHIEGILNAVAGIYEAELGVTIELVHLNIWETEEDPYSATDPLDLLLELRDWWNSNQDAVDRDTVHLFTGKNLDSATVGIAYVSTVCNRSNAYGLSQEVFSDALLALLVAHEMGHNLGALHDPGSSSPRYIMYPSLSSANLDEFSEASLADIAAYLDRVNCLSTRPQDGGDGGDSGDAGDGGDGDDEPPEPRRRRSGGGPVDGLFLVVIAGALAGSVCRRLRRAACGR
jgi:hypothetical protein